MTALVSTLGATFNFNFLKRWFNDYRRYQLIRQTRNELAALTDKELWDIGITRGEIWDIANSSHPAETNKNLGGWV